MEADFNSWHPKCDYDAVLANQSLHHVLNLEGLFDEIGRALRPEGRFIVSDMIGRNGHRRWCTALEMIWSFWRELPPSYRFNLKFSCFQEWYEDRDYSTVGFEGVRSEDILPLLVDTFNFEMFFGFGNLIDPFVDRAFGPHFQPEKRWDRDFIDRVHQRDQFSIEAGLIAPTHLLAVMRKSNVNQSSYENVAPAVCIESRFRQGLSTIRAGNAYQKDCWDFDPNRELDATCAMLAKVEIKAHEKALLIEELGQEVLQQSNWGMALDRELELARIRIVQLQDEVVEKNLWAMRVQGSVIPL